MKYGDWSKRDWSKYDWSKYGDRSKWSRDWTKWKADAAATTAASAEKFAHDLHAKIKRDFDSKMARKFEAKAEKFERKLKARFDHQTQKYGGVSVDPAQDLPPPPPFKNDAERQTYDRARKRAQAEAGFYVHLMWYGIIIGFLFIINLITTPFGYQWWVWPAIGWGFGITSHFAAVYGWRWVHEQVFQPTIEREVKREVLQEKEQLRTEKQASLDELTATFAHEIRNPIAAAKSLVQQMGEDPTSHENVEYAKVALDELARVERSVSHLLKYAKEEDYKFDNVNLAWVVDGALTQMRAKLESNSVIVSRAYLSGPTVRADADKLRQVFSNIIDNAIDAMESTTGERRLEFAIQNNGNGMATVRIRDNGCGIADDKIAKIFNPFYTSKTNGTGLGLGVAKKVIDAHRGTIEVHSEAGQGTEFVLAIPLSDAVRDSADQSTDETFDEAIVEGTTTEPLPTSDAQNNGSGAATSPIVPMAADAPSAQTSRLRN
ncbi:MAG TPA: HAMP domain-containing sensor histidine kinase [Patescibacteria group bacterium]|nr:HAMP domain-containing sensor histidine kinase [Patescibacteria group bacterium]